MKKNSGTKPIKSILSQINLRPTSMSELVSIAYPGATIDHYRPKVRAIIRALNFIVSGRHKYTINKRGLRELKKLTKESILNGSIIRETRIPDKIYCLTNSGISVPIPVNNEKHFATPEYEFLSEIENELELIENLADSDKRLNCLIETIINAKGSEVAALDDTYLAKAREIIKTHKVLMKSEKEYFINPTKAFKLLVTHNKIKNNRKIDTKEFRLFLCTWLISDILRKPITSTNAKEIMRNRLKEYEVDVVMGNFLFSRFGIKTRIKKIIDKTLVPTDQAFLRLCLENQRFN